MLKRVLSDSETCNYTTTPAMDGDFATSFNFLNFTFLIIFKIIVNAVTFHCCFFAFCQDFAVLSCHERTAEIEPSRYCLISSVYSVENIYTFNIFCT